MYAATHGFKPKMIGFQMIGMGSHNPNECYRAMVGCPGYSMKAGQPARTKGQARDQLGATVREEAEKRFNALYPFFGLHGSRRGG